MATCKHCGKSLILMGGKCIYCGADPNQAMSVKDSGGKSKFIVQRKTFSTREGNTPYSQYAGQSIIPGAKTDRYGNPQGSQYDLAKDGAFKGYKIVVLDLCHEGNFSLPRPALEKKGFCVTTFSSSEANDLQRLNTELYGNKSQLWIVSSRDRCLSSDCCKLIYDYFNKGNGLYVWSDNDPYFADSNVLLKKMFDSEMSGNYYASQVLSIQSGEKQPGIIRNHPITTGIQNFYEGITISNVKLTQDLNPLVYSSDGKIVTAFYDRDGKRALIDGGFTRLYCNWDSAGTDRFVVNCAAWLTNIERFGYHPE